MFVLSDLDIDLPVPANLASRILSVARKTTLAPFRKPNCRLYNVGVCLMTLAIGMRTHWPLINITIPQA